MAGVDLEHTHALRDEAADVPGAHPGRLIAAPVLYDTAGTVRLLRAARLSINMKLHGSVLSAASGTPFVSIAYHSKVFEFADDVGLGEFAVRTDALEGGGNAARATLQAVGGVLRGEEEARRRCRAAVARASAEYERVSDELLALLTSR